MKQEEKDSEIYLWAKDNMPVWVNNIKNGMKFIIVLIILCLFSIPKDFILFKISFFICLFLIGVVIGCAAVIAYYYLKYKGEI